VDTLSRFSALYTAGRTYETVLPMTLNDRLFGSIRLGVSTTLLRREVTGSLQQSLAVAAVALPLPGSPRWCWRSSRCAPIRAIVGQVDRIRRGEPLEATRRRWAATSSRSSPPAHPPRARAAGGSAVDPQRKGSPAGSRGSAGDGVIFLNPERHILFFNRAAEAVVASRSSGRSACHPRVLDPAHRCCPS